VIPVHPALVQLGFERHAEECRLKKKLLLSGIKRSSSGYASDNVSKWFRRFLKFTIGDEEKRASKLSFHSFRHTMKDAMRAAGIDDRVQDALIGHETDHVSARYGVGYKPARLHEEFKKVTFPGLDLSHLEKTL
jgi:integrase